jgi:hypothetical protein
MREWRERGRENGAYLKSSDQGVGLVTLVGRGLARIAVLCSNQIDSVCEVVPAVLHLPLNRHRWVVSGYLAASINHYTHTHSHTPSIHCCITSRHAMS